MSESLLTSREGRVLRLTLNRPEKRNALDMDLCRRLLAAIERAGDDPSVGAILLDAAGRDFCSGMDLIEILEADAAELAELHRALFTTGARLLKPMVAQVAGAALAGGLGLALNAHIIVAEPAAMFGLTETRIGLWPYVIFSSVVAATGVRKATELALTGRTFDAEEAHVIGIVDRIVERERLHEEALRTALGLAQGSADANRNGLAFVRETLGLAPEAAAQAAVEYRRKAYGSADFREGVLAFRQKRNPVWPSHER